MLSRRWLNLSLRKSKQARRKRVDPVSVAKDLNDSIKKEMPHVTVNGKRLKLVKKVKMMRRKRKETKGTIFYPKQLRLSRQPLPQHLRLVCLRVSTWMG